MPHTKLVKNGKPHAITADSLVEAIEWGTLPDVDIDWHAVKDADGNELFVCMAGLDSGDTREIIQSKFLALLSSCERLPAARGESATAPTA